MDFVKSPLTVNPCMVRDHSIEIISKNLYDSKFIVIIDFVIIQLILFSLKGHHGHLYLQGEDRLYLNLGSGISAHTGSFHLANEIPLDNTTQMLSGSKQWLVVPIPIAYSGSNWPIRVRV